MEDIKVEYARKGKLNGIWTVVDSTGLTDYFMTVTNKTGNREWACEFDGGLIRTDENGEPKKVKDLLLEDIKKNGGFYLHDTAQTPRRAGSNEYIADVLYRLYYPENENPAPAKLRTSGPIVARGDLAKKVPFYKEHDVVDMTMNNLCQKGEDSFLHSKGITTQGPEYNLVSYDGDLFYTDSDPGLLKVLRKISAWHKEDKGALRMSAKEAKAPLSNIVYWYHQGKLSGDNDVYEQLGKLKDEASGTTIEIDHLTGNKHINYLWALTPVQRTVNTSLGNRRSRIRKPFYFYTVSQMTEKEMRLLVRCGYDTDTQHYEKRFVFSDPAGQGGEDYRTCFNEFQKKVPKSYRLDKPGEGNLLYEWTSPERIHDKENPVTKLLTDPLDSFAEYHEGAFDDMQYHEEHP